MTRLALTLAALAFAPAAMADDAAPADPEKKSFTGEGSLTGGYTTGNAETLDLGAALDLERDFGVWILKFNGSAVYGENEGEATQERYFAALQVDRQITERLSGFVRSSYEVDEFSGFESRIFAGVGAAYIPIENDKAKWTLEAGPGFRIDEVRAVVDPTTGAILEPSSTERSFSARGASNFRYKFNENVELANNSSATYAQETTQLMNRFSLTSALVGGLSARFSLEVRHDTNPPTGFEATDTTTRAALVYTFGDD